MTKPNDLWDDMSILNSLYGELCWENNDPIEFIPDYENDQIIVKRKNGIERLVKLNQHK